MHLRSLLLVSLVLAGVAATSARAEEEKQDVAKICEAQALKAHPKKLPNTEATDNLRQDYYTTCINRGGKMNPFGEQQ
jgi:phage-related tail protein